MPRRYADVRGASSTQRPASCGEIAFPAGSKVNAASWFSTPRSVSDV